jgi:hypothetical protein
MFETDEFKCPTFIPSSIWKDVNIFSGHLPNNIKKLLRDHFDILCFKLQFAVPYLHHFQNKLKLWLAYILSHPTLEIEDINHLSDKLEFNVHEKNVAASILGRWDLFDTTHIIEHSAKSELIEFFRIAYIHHHTDFILELFAQYPLLKPELIHHNHHEVIIHACHNGDIALIKLLLQQLLNTSKYKRTLPIEGFFSATEENTSHSVTPTNEVVFNSIFKKVIS